jgi:ankyrin repeat protein
MRRVDLLLATRATSTRGPNRRYRADDRGARRPPDLVKKLRTRGASVNQQGWTPLIYAATGGHDDIVRYLLAEGSEIDASSPNGTTALMMAAREGKRSTVDLLIARGADVNRRNQSGVSALDWARRAKEPAMVERLQRAGAR